jgi:hypothetical protein
LVGDFSFVWIWFHATFVIPGILLLPRVQRCLGDIMDDREEAQLDTDINEVPGDAAAGQPGPGAPAAAGTSPTQSCGSQSRRSRSPTDMTITGNSPLIISEETLRIDRTFRPIEMIVRPREGYGVETAIGAVPLFDVPIPTPPVSE